MKKILFSTAIALSVLATGAQAGEEALAREKGCMACHSVDKKIVGPSYKDVAAKYAGKGQEATLVEHVLKGSKGVWGPVPMPPNKVTEDEAKKLVAWILTLK